jgi:hypothetical protein
MIKYTRNKDQVNRQELFKEIAQKIGDPALFTFDGSEVTVGYEIALSSEDEIRLYSIIDNHIYEEATQKIGLQLTDVGGFTQFQSFEIDVLAAMGTYSTTITFPFNINIKRAHWFNRSSFDTDSIDGTIAKNTVVGIITQNVAINDTVINVSDTVLDNVYLGFLITIEGQDMGRVIDCDQMAKTITVENAATAAITATGSEYVLMTIELVPHIYLEGTETQMTLEGGVGAMKLAANTPVEINYHNNSGTAKKYSVILEYFY